MHEAPRAFPATDTDVLIVGAGPVGLFLANECARRGRRWRLVEARSSQSMVSKALAIFPRTFEIFDMAGIVDPFVEAANRVTSLEVLVRGGTLAHLKFTPESPYPFLAMVPQDVTERLLVQALEQRGGTVEYDTSFVTAIQHDDHVSATLDHLGQRLELTARYVVGCDGAHSAVRHLLNLSFEGAEYDASFMLADIETNEALPADQLQLCPSALGPLAVFPMSSTRRRIVATIDHQQGDAPSLELVRRALRQRGPNGLEARRLLWSSYFRIHRRHTADLRVGRMFIAGDAAHIHSPFGGQGMNTGLQDVWNLAWKLDLVLRGLGNDALLQSYAAERLPVIKDVIAITDLMTKALGTKSKAAQALRNAVLPLVSRLPSFQHAFVQRLSELGIKYAGSPIVEGAGQRYLDDSMRGGGICSRFLLLCGQDSPPSTKETATRLAESRSEVMELRMTSGHGLMLVRPDGYAAYSADSGDATTALSSIRSLLERQTSGGGRADRPFS